LRCVENIILKLMSSIDSRVTVKNRFVLDISERISFIEQCNRLL
jgi:hypothetical protein